MGRISSNDILHAILLKIIYRFNTESGDSCATSDPDQISRIRVLFARNMRSVLGLEDWAVGDYVRLQCLEASMSAVQEQTIAELSMANRISLSESIDDKYIRECKWFLEYKDRYGSLCGSPDFMADKGAAVVTNWSSFPYENIIFDHSSPVELLLAPTPFTSSQAMFVVVAFRGKGSERKLVIKINSLHDGVISAVKAVAAESGLFSYEEAY